MTGRIGRTSMVAALSALALTAAGGAPADAGAATGTSVLDDVAAFKDPGKDVRPKFRMWWGELLGGSVDPATVEQELQAISDAGFGGVELGFSGGAWANDAQRTALKATLLKAKQLGLTIDMTLGASWPFNTPNTKADSGLSEQELMYGREDVTGGTTYDGAPPAPIGDDSDAPAGDVIAITAAKVITRGPAVTEPGTPPASSTILDPSSFVDLTATRREDGTVRWQAPAGDWILFAFWQRDAAEEVVDHLRAESAQAGLAYLDEHQLGAENRKLLPGVGGSFFEDSLELDASELFWTGDMPSEFRARRGYDMTKFLPLFYVQGMHRYWVPEAEPTPDFELPDGSGHRYRQDYYETIQDLYVDEHIDVIARWAETHQMRFRSQVAFGNSFDVTRSAREITKRGGLADDESLNAGDILPFGPGSRDWRFAMDHYRTLVAGSHQGGSSRIGFELGAVFLQELNISLTDYRAMMDKAFAAGITRPLVHGYQTQAPGAPWPGSDHFIGLVTESWNHKTFPQWKQWRTLADYWARGTTVLEQGTPRTDVAILRDGFSTTAATITGEVPEVIDGQLGDLPQGLRQPLKQAVAGTQPPRPKPFFDTDALEQRGFSLQYLDPLGVKEGQVAGRGVLFPDGPAYRAVVVDQRWMPAVTAEALDRASADGLEVVFVGTPPSRADSARDPEAEDARVRAAVSRIRGRATTRVVAAQADVAGALSELDLRPAAAWSQPARLYTQRRRSRGTETYYVYNATDEAVRVNGSFVARGAPQRLDLWNGTVTELGQWRQVGDRVTVPLRLGPGEAQAFTFRPQGGRRAHVVSSTADEVVTDGDRVIVNGPGGSTASVDFSDGSSQERVLPAVPAPLGVTAWSLAVSETGPEGETPRLVPAPLGLGDWRTKPGLATASGTGTYTAQVTLPEGFTGADRGVRLDLGRIAGAAIASVNGKRVSGEISPRKALDVTSLLKPGANTLEVVLTTTLKNKAQALAPLVAQSRPVFAATPGTQPYGLIGPVTLVPYARATIERPVLADAPAGGTPGGGAQPPAAETPGGASQPPAGPASPPGAAQPPAGSSAPSSGVRARVRAELTRRVLAGGRLRVACRLTGATLRTCRVAVQVRRGDGTRTIRTVTVRPGRSAVVRVGNARRLVLRARLTATDGRRFIVARTLMRRR